MCNAHTEAQKRIAEAATSKADALFLKLFAITEIVKLAAFAVEAQRRLQEVKNATHFQPEMQAVIADSGPASNSWLEMENPAAGVLSYAARELEALNSEFTETVYDLAIGLTGSAVLNKNGGVP